MAAPYKVLIPCGSSFRAVMICYGGDHPQYARVCRTTFTQDGHVDLVGIDMPGLPRELISHMDSSRFVFMTLQKTGPVKAFLNPRDIVFFQRTCFLCAQLG